jgi:hypothetical protein
MPRQPDDCQVDDIRAADLRHVHETGRDCSVERADDAQHGELACDFHRTQFI